MGKKLRLTTARYCDKVLRYHEADEGDDTKERSTMVRFCGNRADDYTEC